MMPPSITKYGSPVRLDTQIVAVRAHCARTALKAPSIAFGGAPQREADSQPISQLVRQAVSQTVSRASRLADRNTQFGFFRWQTRLQAVGRAVTVITTSGRMVMHPTTDLWVGGLNPGRPSAGLSALLNLPLVQTLLSTNF